MTSSPFKILLIDEDKDDRATLLRLLTESGRRFRLYEAPSGDMGREWFRRVQPDCVVMELKYTDAIGMEVLNLIKTEMDRKPVPVFIWSKLGGEMLMSGASMFGVKGFFRKTKSNEAPLIAAILDAVGEKP